MKYSYFKPKPMTYETVVTVMSFKCLLSNLLRNALFLPEAGKEMC